MEDTWVHFYDLEDVMDTVWFSNAYVYKSHEKILASVFGNYQKVIMFVILDKSRTMEKMRKVGISILFLQHNANNSCFRVRISGTSPYSPELINLFIGRPRFIADSL